MSSESYTTTESTHTVSSPDPSTLYTKTWKPITTSPPTALLVFIHGYSDHCNAYGILFPHLASRGIEVRAIDQRGWGRSVRKPTDKGDSGGTDRVLGDITSFLREVIADNNREHKDVPIFLMGHSMGGAEVLHYAASGPEDVKRHIRGYLAEAPLVALHPATRPWGTTVVLGRVAAKIAPKTQKVNKLDEKLLSRDPEVQRAFVDDELCHDTGTLEQLAGMLDRGLALERGNVRIPRDVRSVWISHGTDDGVCEFKAAKDMFERMEVEDKEFKAYQGWYHKLHAEPGEDKTIFADDVADWILARCDQPSSMQAKSKL
ncbi:hypothetical protein W97_02534 [Coniosporium apollinis CBS 100218]|uniref:Serine aminopeptidase S33 domain-containing protein n=1 Tax=Coniosporium apollinis (strain CBS 100218) TaxID=1168221 RepID=R7YN30_CONA1|nr:uncharacterized protein W97_02534 [Coniosporium apollinis CBS 100218]EON63307.1 hypothetical protein W97_02534 [Coniosporium apollinis CBS 100218]